MTAWLHGWATRIGHLFYTGGAFGTAWDSAARAESHTLRHVPGIRCYPSVVSGTFGYIEG